MRNLLKALLCLVALIASAVEPSGASPDHLANAPSSKNGGSLGVSGWTSLREAGRGYQYRDEAPGDMGPTTPGPTNPNGPRV
jgi:hypothetical protein